MYVIRTLLLLNLFKEKIALLLISLFMITITIALFIMVNRVNPGYLEKEGFGIVELIDVYRSEFICGYCEVKKAHGTRHCHTCGKCVKVLLI